MSTRRNILITGAAGFIGREACRRWRQSHHVIGIDDLSRGDGQCLIAASAACDEFHMRDVADIEDIPLPAVDTVIHLAGQVSVTRSIDSPMRDFNSNAMATVKLVEWARRQGVRRFIFASTNKVYGDLPGRTSPICDSQPIDPKTPYGISKAAADLYVRDRLPDAGIVFRQSCIYGETQAGSIDQGWVGFLARQIKADRLVTCFGDGTQVRDLLHVDDLLSAYALAIAGDLDPGTYVIGGGQDNALTFADAVALMQSRIRNFEGWRPHDQRYFVSANQGMIRAGWRPTISAHECLPGLI